MSSGENAYSNAASEGTIDSATAAIAEKNYANQVISFKGSFRNDCSCFVIAIAFNASTDNISQLLVSFAFVVSQ